jgi:hypothetical protein
VDMQPQTNTHMAQKLVKMYKVLCWPFKSIISKILGSEFEAILILIPGNSDYRACNFLNYFSLFFSQTYDFLSGFDFFFFFFFNFFLKHFVSCEGEH